MANGRGLSRKEKEEITSRVSLLNPKKITGDPSVTVGKDTVLRKDMNVGGQAGGLAPSFTFPPGEQIRQTKEQIAADRGLSRAKTTALAQGGKVAAGASIPTNVEVLESPRQRNAKGLAPSGQAAQPEVGSFGLPTDRLPSFGELGGAIGQLFKHVGGIARKRRSLGLIPGRTATSTAVDKGLKGKDLANILIKQLEAANLAGDEDKAAAINARLEAIINPEEASDLEAIENE